MKMWEEMNNISICVGSRSESHIPWNLELCFTLTFIVTFFPALILVTG